MSSVILLFVKKCSSIFPFGAWDRLLVLIGSVPEVPFIQRTIDSSETDPISYNYVVKVNTVS